MAADLIVDLADGVSTVTINRPDRMNAMVPDLQKALLQTLDELDRSAEVRAIVLTGAGRAFCAGADLSVLEDINDLIGTDALQAAAPVLQTPVIAAVNGAAIGIGFAIMLFADVIYVAEGAHLSSRFSQLGLIAEWGSAWTLQRRVGVATAADILLSGRTVSPAEALEVGLAQRVLAADALIPAATEWAQHIASTTSPYAVAVIKRQLAAASVQSFSDAFDLSLALEESALSRPDLTEAMAARQERRPVKFPPFQRS